MKRVYIMCSLAAFLVGAMSVDANITGAYIGLDMLYSASPLFSFTAFAVSFAFYVAGTHHLMMGRV
ncbi:hypothetical protein CMO91_02430 [Candidatus Woesearchaeota archaeon]|nr:hypothetical protein [Candidatus Woesearchaeota archaeon]|tara:strand:- start:432 stop:629 length:198 start_codon:yes stop_codon:yes gene_type:complete